MQPKEVVAKNIRDERQKQNLTQEALAHLTEGITPVRLSQVERAIHDPRLKTIVEIAKALGLPPADLLRDL